MNKWCAARMGVAYSFRESPLDATLSVEPVHKVSLMQDFCKCFGIDLSLQKIIHRWYHQLEETGCLCRGKSLGRPCTSDENVQ